MALDARRPRSQLFPTALPHWKGDENAVVGEGLAPLAGEANHGASNKLIENPMPTTKAAARLR